jgi:retinol-binding protein 3
MPQMNKPPLALIAAQIEELYLFPDKGQKIIQMLLTSDFDAASENALAELITARLIGLSQDNHFFLRYSPDELASQGNHEAIMQAHGERARFDNYGFRAVEHLAGNIGYWHLTELAPPFVSGELLNAAISLLANSDAIILDLQGNRGGSPEMVQAIASQFVAADKSLSGIDSPKRGYEPMKTLDNAQRLLNKPLVILIDGETFSGAEALAYDLQLLKRAPIIGKRSKGGAHLTNFIGFEGKWLLRVPVARAFNPISEGNWERTGVAPDIESNTALITGQGYLLENLIAEIPNSSYRPNWETALKRLNQ